jgi:hypothetical protein
MFSILNKKFKTLTRLATHFNQLIYGWIENIYTVAFFWNCICSPRVLIIKYFNIV